MDRRLTAHNKTVSTMIMATTKRKKKGDKKKETVSSAVKTDCDIASLYWAKRTTNVTRFTRQIPNKREKDDSDLSVSQRACLQTPKGYLKPQKLSKRTTPKEN